jgi:hypothetical protein
MGQWTGEQRANMPIIADALVLAGGTQSVFQTTAGSNLLLNAPGSNRLAGSQFYVSASGYVSGGAGTYTAAIQPILYGDVSPATVTTKPLFSGTAGTYRRSHSENPVRQ